MKKDFIIRETLKGKENSEEKDMYRQVSNHLVIIKRTMQSFIIQYKVRLLATV